MPKSPAQLPLQSLPKKTSDVEESQPTGISVIKLKDVEESGLLRAELAAAELATGAALRKRDRLIEEAAAASASGVALSPLVAQRRDLNEKLQAAAQDLQDVFDAWEASGIRFQETASELYAERESVLEHKAHVSEECAMLHGSVAIAQEGLVKGRAELEELVASHESLVHEQREEADAFRLTSSPIPANAKDDLGSEAFSELAAERGALAEASARRAEAFARREERCARAATWQSLYDKSSARAASQQAKADRAVERSLAAEAMANEERARLEALAPSIALVLDQTNVARYELERANRLCHAASAVFALALVFALVKLVQLVL